MTPRLVQRLDFLDEVCAGKRVLHLGCADSPYTDEAIAAGTLLHGRLSKVAASVTGLDGDIEGLEKLRRAGFDDLVVGDLEKLEDTGLENNFDVIVAGEIIEHLSNPGIFLNGVRSLMNPSTKLVVTTINAYCGMRSIYYSLTRGKGTHEPVHPDHVAYYSYSTLNLLLKRHALSVEDFLFYDMGTDHRKTTPWYLKVFNDVSVTFSRQLADGVIAVCTKEADGI
ncbi:MAG: class I SAM-dependent methyltransferase [Pyrinomonadaceae bacterium]|nr:class I SAM-dependent methyltransferase [Pyrinomonadaceae bacterium]